ncbi:MAG: hypothetical protein IPO22_14825 [Anaerolineales bacterium]|nr:hypothetical protein [Anaerolineales bacterium]
MIIPPITPQLLPPWTRQPKTCSQSYLEADWCNTNENRCEITDVALSPQGDLVAISTISTYDASQGPKIIIWNIKNNKIEKVLEQLNIIYYSLEWSNDGSFLYAGGGCSSSPGGLNEYACEYEENSSYETFTIWESKSWTRYYGMRANDFLDKTEMKFIIFTA